MNRRKVNGTKYDKLTHVSIEWRKPMRPIPAAGFVAAMVLAGITLTAAQTMKTTIAGDRTSVDLTIYNQNLSLIREERSLSLPRGMSRAISARHPDDDRRDLPSLPEPYRSFCRQSA